MYLLFKYLHIVCVAASFALLFVRGLWLLRAFPAAQESWVRILPFAVDGVLVLTAIGMLFMGTGKGWPDWLWAKFGYIVLYAALCLVVFRVAGKRWQRSVAWAGALVLFLFLTTVSVLHEPLGILVLLK